MLFDVSQWMTTLNHRHVRVAQILDPNSKKPLDELLTLYDVAIVAVSGDTMTLSGIEHLPDELGERVHHYAQSWLLKGSKRSNQPEKEKPWLPPSTIDSWIAKL